MYDPLRAKAKVVVYAAVTFLFGLGIASGLGWTSVSHAMPLIATAPQVSPEAVQPALDLSEAFTNLAEAVTPAVVRIETRRPRSAPTQSGAQPDPETLRRFFPDLPFGPDGGAPPDGAPRDEAPLRPRVAGGTGFIVSDDGYILTNNHVVVGAQEVTVYFEDRRQFTAKIVGADPFTDVAVIKIDSPDPLPVMAFGDSDAVKVGEWILAIGNPGFGGMTQLNFSVTAGIISARGRALDLLRNDLFNDPRYVEQASWSIEDFIQTDAVINPGNSGGPMVNLHGQVVGINSAIASETGGYQGYGFAIPINLARRVMEDLVEYGHVRRPRIGVAIENVSPEDAEFYGLPSIAGVFVQEVQSDGPAVGLLRAEDVIVAIEGESVGYSAELQAKIAQQRPGDVVRVTVYRERRPLDVNIRLAEAPINGAPQVSAPPMATSEQRLGIGVEPLDAERAQAFGFSEPGGVVLTDVAPGSAVDRRQGMRYQGQRLLRINDDVINTPDDVRAALNRVDSGQIVSLHFEARDGIERVLNVRMP